jgi:hypothetical protein
VNGAEAVPDPVQGDAAGFATYGEWIEHIRQYMPCGAETVDCDECPSGFEDGPCWCATCRSYMEDDE